MNSYRKVNILSTNDRNYLAGLIDGEGTITLSRKQAKAQRHLSVGIANNELNILEWVLKTVGAGKITSKKAYKATYSKSYTFQIYSQQALSLLEQVVKYLHSYKKKRAELAIEHYTNLTPRNGKYTSEILIKRGLFEESFFKLTVDNGGDVGI